MISWMREKLAERRARNKRNAGEKATPNTEPATVSNVAEGENEDKVGPAPSPRSFPSNSPVAQRIETSEEPHCGRRRVRSDGADVSSTQRNLSATPPTKRVNRLRNNRRCSNSSSLTPISDSRNNSNDALNGGPVQKERVKVRVICPSARILNFQIDVNKRLTELKNEAILELADDPVSQPLFATDVRQLSPRYRLFRAEYQGVELNETLTLSQLQIGDNDTLMLTPRRNNLQQMTTITRDMHPPRLVDIEIATRALPVRTVVMPMVDINEIFQQSNLQFDVRKVLISLAQASAAVIGAGPYAARLIAMLKQKLINKRNYQNDTLQCLVDMGFKKEKAEYALKINQGVYSSALEWLIQNQSDDNPSEVLPTVGIQKSQSIISPSAIFTNDSVIENCEALLEIVRIYSHRDIPPTTDTVSALVEMGFEESDVLTALKKTCNNKAAACEWLCGNRTDSLIELREGLAQDSPILKAILQMPQVQMNLSNPKILLAFLSILENENSIRVWGGDNDTTSVITHILQKYHEEKHVLGINQFYSNRS